MGFQQWLLNERTLQKKCWNKSCRAPKYEHFYSCFFFLNDCGGQGAEVCRNNFSCKCYQFGVMWRVSFESVHIRSRFKKISADQNNDCFAYFKRHCHYYVNFKSDKYHQYLWLKCSILLANLWVSGDTWTVHYWKNSDTCLLVLSKYVICSAWHLV